MEKEKFDFLAFMREVPVPRIAILGATGSGKTVFARKLCGHYLTRKRKILVVDPKWEFDDIKTLNLSEFLPYDRKSFIRKLRSLQYCDLKFENPVQISEFLASLCWYFTPSILYLEEIAEYIGKNDHLPESHPLVYKVLQQGRSQKAGIIAATQMVSQLNLAFVRQSNEIFVFAMGKEETRTLEKHLGLERDTLAFNLPTRAEKAKGIVKDLYCFYEFQHGTAPTFYKPIKFNKR